MSKTKKISSAKSSKTSKLFSDILEMKSGDFNQHSLVKLIDEIIVRARGADPDASVLLHLPKNLAGTLRRKLRLSENPRLDTLYFNKSIAENDQLIISPVCSIPPRNHLRNEFLLILAGQALSAFVSAQENPLKENEAAQLATWQVSLSFAPDEVLNGIRHFQSLMGVKSRVKTDCAKSLEESVSNLLTISDNGKLPTWGNFLPNFIIDLEQEKLEREGELKWFQLISRVQDAVGWELDTGKLFEAISHVLKNTIGFQYLEIQILEGKGNKFDVTAVHHRNDTAFGGKLLTVILRPDRRDEILKSRKPFIVDSEEAERTLMNPRLMKYMSLNSGIIVPLVYQKRTNGLLKLFGSKPDHFTKEDVPGMEAIGRILARSVENVKVHTHMKRMATIDGLTNLYNRRFFTEQLTREFKRSKRYDSNLTLIMIDVDFFKHYNDALGHLRGDQVLVVVSQLLKANVREVDIVTRYGGEEFAIILPEANLEHGVLVGEKIRSEIEAHPFKHEERQPGGKLTLSLGVASNTADVDTINELINRADIALYRAKKSGRNKCVTFE